MGLSTYGGNQHRCQRLLCNPFVLPGVIGVPSLLWQEASVLRCCINDRRTGEQKEIPKKERANVIPMPYAWLFNFCALLCKRLLQSSPTFLSNRAAPPWRQRITLSLAWNGSGRYGVTKSELLSPSSMPCCGSSHKPARGLRNQH